MVVIFGFTLPFQKRKLSWSDTDNSGKIPAKHKQHQHGKHGSCQAETSLDAASRSLPGSPKKRRTEAEETVEPARCGCTFGHEFTDDSRILSRQSYLCSKGENENRKQPDICLLSPCGSPAAQDSSVSSSDTVSATDSP